MMGVVGEMIEVWIGKVADATDFVAVAMILIG